MITTAEIRHEERSKLLAAIDALFKVYTDICLLHPLVARTSITINPYVNNLDGQNTACKETCLGFADVLIIIPFGP